MNFSLSDEQQMLADSARRFVQGGYQTETLWRQFAELGWLALPFDEDDGGLGAGLVETMVLLEELGRGGVTTPYLATVVFGRRHPAPRRRGLPCPLSAGPDGGRPAAGVGGGRTGACVRAGKHRAASPRGGRRLRFERSQDRGA